MDIGAHGLDAIGEAIEHAQQLCTRRRIHGAGNGVGCFHQNADGGIRDAILLFKRQLQLGRNRAGDNLVRHDNLRNRLHGDGIVLEAARDAYLKPMAYGQT
ncbi:MAG: hypothetical protein RR209_00790, partial [Angelakisella sp.]